MDARLPSLPLESWRGTKETLHLFSQVVGKVRLALAPRRNHWWHVTYRVSARGLTTGRIPHRDSAFEVEFDWVDHGLEVRSSTGARVRIPLRDGLSVAAFHRRLFEHLRSMGIDVSIRPEPYDLSFSDVPFAEDEGHASYDVGAAGRFGDVLRWTAGVMEEFAGRFEGKTSPVHFFWHSFDLAVTRFSGRRAPERPDWNAVERNAYSHEVASFGFWPGDERVPAPAFYGYAAPVPEGLADEPLVPGAARWTPEEGMALLPYDDVRRSDDPRATLLSFYESVYRAARARARWDDADRG